MMSFIDDFSITRWSGVAMAVAAASLTSGCNSVADTKGDASESDSNNTAIAVPTPESTPSSTAGPPGTGIATGSIKVNLSIVNEPNSGTYGQEGWVQLITNNVNDEPLADAIVELLVNGRMVYLDENGSFQPAVAIKTIDLSVRSKEGSRTGVHLVGPSLNTVALLNVLAVNTPNTLQWLPNNEDGVTSNVQTGFSCNSLWVSASLADPGIVTIPAKGFSELEDFFVELRRSRTWDDGPGFHADFATESITQVGAKSIEPETFVLDEGAASE